jgi:hypothetical protein
VAGASVAFASSALAIPAQAFPSPAFILQQDFLSADFLSFLSFSSSLTIEVMAEEAFAMNPPPTNAVSKKATNKFFIGNLNFLKYTMCLPQLPSLFLQKRHFHETYLVKKRVLNTIFVEIASC